MTVMSESSRHSTDAGMLRARKRPLEAEGDGVRAVDLFAGCGGMSVGLWEAARRLDLRLDLPLVLEKESAYASVYQTNFPKARVESGLVEEFFPGVPGASLSKADLNLRSAVGPVDILVGGPPCQGHSDLNNWTRRSDPRNQLYLRMARAAQVLEPSIVVIENVTAVQRDVDDVVGQTADALRSMGYAVASHVADLHRIGVPQRRRRHLLVASSHAPVVPEEVLASLDRDMSSGRDLRWAIGDLEDVSGPGVMDLPSSMSEANRARAEYLVRTGSYELPDSERPPCHRDGGHSYKSVYGRLHWELPAQTITTGFGSMGQGRYLHPSRIRTLTPHEAARIQTFPDWFSFGAEPKRTQLATMIGNAVPPLLMVRLGAYLIEALRATGER